MDNLCYKSINFQKIVDLKRNVLDVVRMRVDGISGCQLTDVNLDSSARDICTAISCFRYLQKIENLSQTDEKLRNLPMIIAHSPELHYIKLKFDERGTLKKTYRHPLHHALSTVKEYLNHNSKQPPSLYTPIFSHQHSPNL